MIKSLLDADENPPPGTKVVVEEITVEQPTANALSDTVFSPEQTAEATDILEIPAPANRVNTTIENTAAQTFDAPTKDVNFQIFGETATPENTNSASSATDEKQMRTNQSATIFQTEYQPESTAETMRKSGLAYAAAITLFGAVVFMMILGWGADLLFGSSPWGIVGGIVLGAIIGFFQFFRLTAQIIKNKE